MHQPRRYGVSSSTDCPGSTCVVVRGSKSKSIPGTLPSSALFVFQPHGRTDSDKLFSPQDTGVLLVAFESRFR